MYGAYPFGEPYYGDAPAVVTILVDRTPEVFRVEAGYAFRALLQAGDSFREAAQGSDGFSGSVEGGG